MNIILQNYKKLIDKLMKDYFTNKIDTIISSFNGYTINNCIEAHHKRVPYECIGAEICANADCYRFIHPKGVLAYESFLVTKIDNLEEITEKLKSKLEEKHKIISLDKVKEDLEKYTQIFKKMFDKITNTESIK